MLEKILRDYRFVCGNSGFVRRVLLFFFSISFHLLAYYRLAHWLIQNRGFRFLLHIVLFRMQKETSCYINPKAEIGEDCNFVHPLGIVIGENVKIGDNVTIYQNVTLGVRRNKDGDVGYPIIGNSVTVFAGAILIGPITIGTGAVIGAGAVVVNDVPDHMTVVGNPAKIIISSNKKTK